MDSNRCRGLGIVELMPIFFKMVLAEVKVSLHFIDWAGSIDDRKSISGYVFKLNLNAVCWSSKKQHTTTLSSSEAEYIAVTGGTCQAIWLRRILCDIKQNQTDQTVIYCDNQSTIAMIKNPVHQNRTKHIEIRYHFIRDQLANDNIVLKHCSTDQQLADIFTKSLPVEKFVWCREGLGINEFGLTGAC
uniref:Copia protein n=1 Tax=Ananas comosus var. bracteatus TaxID=296719 RepID=A0A6V7QC69_ANACO|nr:unnamed protein product [Ananas comosus var. bracteatus]